MTFLFTIDAYSVYDIDLDEAVWTPVDLVPYSVVTPTVMSRFS